MTIAEILQGLDDRRLVAVADARMGRSWTASSSPASFAAGSGPNTTPPCGSFRPASGPQFVALVVACGTVDAAGAAVFAPSITPGSRKRTPAAVGRLFEAIDERNLITSTAQGGLTKNSETPGNSAA